MLVALQCEKKNESTIKDLLNSVNLDFKLFCSGTLEEVGESLMEKCHQCQNRITSMDSKESEKLWILFILKKKNDSLMLKLLETCFIVVKTFQNVRELFDSERLQCKNCYRKKCIKRSLFIEGPAKTVDPIEEERIKREPQDETVEKARKPVNLGPRLVEIALVKASGIVVKEERDIKNEDETNSLAVETSSIATEDIKQEQDERINEKGTVENMNTVYMNMEADREKDNSSESESSELDSDDSDFFTEHRNRKKFKKSLDSSKFKKRIDQEQLVTTHKDVSLKRVDTLKRQEKDEECKCVCHLNSIENTPQCAKCKRKFRSPASDGNVLWISMEDLGMTVADLRVDHQLMLLGPYSKEQYSFRRCLFVRLTAKKSIKYMELKLKPHEHYSQKESFQSMSCHNCMRRTVFLMCNKFKAPILYTEP